MHDRNSGGLFETCSVHHVFTGRLWRLRVRFVAVAYQVLLTTSTTITITTTALPLIAIAAVRNHGKFSFYPLLIREDLKQRQLPMSDNGHTLFRRRPYY